MAIEQIAARHARQQVALARRTAAELNKLWRRVDRRHIAGSWTSLLPHAVLAVGRAQMAAAADIDSYVDDILEAQGVTGDAAGTLHAGALAGIASDGRPLVSLLQRPVITALRAIGSGASPARALTLGGVHLDMITQTQVADAGRVATSVAITARRQATGYIRVVSAGACSRCIILAGRHYAWNTGFLRHPSCHCKNVPAAAAELGTLQTSPRKAFDALPAAEQDRVFTKAGAEAIRSGADIGKVVNARRGMYTADNRLFTREAAGRRPRLMPEQILRDATAREDAIRLLQRHGYITGSSSRPVRETVSRVPAVSRPSVAKASAPVKVVPAVRAQAADRLTPLAARINADAEAFAARVQRSKTAGYDPHLREIGTEQGFDAPPRVGTRAELDTAVAAGWRETWRGVVGSKTGVSAAQINAALRTGAYEPGRGLYGNGYYLSERRMSAETYRGREPKTNFPAGGGPDFELSDLDGAEAPDSMLRIALDPGARVGDYDTLMAEQKAWLAAQPPGPAKDTFADVGRYAAARGYDVIRIAGRHPDGSFYPGWEDAEDDMSGAVQYAVLNRAVMLVQRAEDVP